MLKSNFQINDLLEPVLKGESSSIEWRRLQLDRLWRLIESHESEILLALKQDLNKPSTEAFFEILALRQELKVAKNNLVKWIKAERIEVPLSLQPSQAFVQAEPLGCILIIGPWNYPFSLTLQPLISCLAAGNTAVLKPSENAPYTSNLINSLISRYFPSDIVQVVEGDGSVAAELLTYNFDHIFFTGGEEIGKKIMKAAADNLTPVTLELGGKSPAIVIDKADIQVTSKRLIWGKALNLGQTCIAPDYLLVQENIVEPLLNSMKESINQFYGSNPLKSIDLAKVINEKQFTRLTNLINNAKNKNQILYGGETDPQRLRISPTIARIDNEDDPLMKAEIFGPILPIVSVKTIDQAIAFIRKRPKPLAIYLFGGGEKEQKRIISQTSSGGICFNDVVLHVGVPELPFGGVGGSGMGRYHGKAGFDNFSNMKSYLKRPFWLDINFRYPPYKLKTSILKKLIG